MQLRETAERSAGEPFAAARPRRAGPVFKGKLGASARKRTRRPGGTRALQKHRSPQARWVPATVEGAWYPCFESSPNSDP
jgi:hypothetical protein